jgi:pectate lyase
MYGIRLINCSNIIINNIRIFNSSVNGILIYNSTNIVVDHVTILDAGRTNVDEGKSIDIREQSCNVTVSHSLLGFTSAVELMIKHRSILIANYSFGPVTNVSLHHNLFYCDYQSSPEISSTGLFDMVNNVIFNYT